MRVILVFIFICVCNFSYSQIIKDSAGIIIDGAGNIFKRDLKAEEEAFKFQQQWQYYLEHNLKANIPVKKRAPIGTYKVIVKFDIDTTGQIISPVAETSYGFGMEEEAIRVIKNGPKWPPLKKDNKLIIYTRRQPITFTVQ